MLYSDLSVTNKNLINHLDFLTEGETTKAPVEIKIRENKRLSQNIINLEEITKYIDDTETDFETAVSEVAKVNNINPTTIAFSVYPYTLYENLDIYYLVRDLQENGDDVYIAQDPRSEISYAVDLLIESCIKNEDDTPLNVLFGLYGLTENRQGPDMRDVGAEMARSFATSMTNSKLLGSVLDRHETMADGSVRVHHNQRVYDALGSFGRKNPNLADGISDAISAGRGMASGMIVDKAETLLRNALRGRNANPQMVNKIDAVTHGLENQMKSHPEKKGFFARLIEKLIQLKNKILEAIRGRR